MVSNEAKISALIYAAGEDGIDLTTLAIQTQLSPAACRQLVEKISLAFQQNDELGIEITDNDETYRIATKPVMAELVSDYVNHNQPQNLSPAALEITAIVAYNQPIARVEIDAIRGVNSSATLHHLLELKIVEIVGEKKEVGHPKLYGVSNFGLHYFGLNSLADLPELPTRKDDTDLEK